MQAGASSLLCAMSKPMRSVLGEREGMLSHRRLPQFPHVNAARARSLAKRSRQLIAAAHGADSLLASNQALDVTGPVAQLIARAAGNAAHGLIEGHPAVGSFLTSLLHDTAIAHATVLDSSSVVEPSLVHAAVDQLTQHTTAVHTSSIAEIAMATSSAATSAPSPGDALHGLALWAEEHLSVIQTMDPVAYASIAGNLNSMLSGMSAALQAQSATTGVPQWTNALVLGVQQLVAGLHVPGTAGGSIEAMLAGQEAMATALAATAAEATSLARAAGVLSGGAALGEMPAGLSWLLQFVLAMVAMVVATVPRSGAVETSPGAQSTRLPLRYDIPALQAYFSHHPVLVLQRNTEVVGKLSQFFLAILADWRMGKWDSNMPERARWARHIVQELGPAYIKIAQAASTRVDVVPEPYVKEFSVLHDKVSTFSTVEARKVLEEGLERPVDSVFEWLSEEPIAAASLGQVYRGMLRPECGGQEVAVKVQRPGALECVCLDIFIMRRAAKLFSQIPGMSDRWATALDDWAERFFMEMDYQLEAHNTMTFKQHMIGLQGVRVATVYPEFTSRKIIVTEWIEGERLGDSKAEDVRALCSTLLNCYLIQLLETGLLHADPHPGNLMRTADGKIVILDFGLMTEVSEDQRIALVEYIAHLTVEDWEGVANDLVKLGFMPEGLPPGAAERIAPLMEKVMGQLVKGGGLKNGFNITAITSELSGVAVNYKLAIPPYFALVLRAFSVIEGIALKVDPKYAIVHECLPYMSRRLLTDNNPRMRAALKQLLYGNGTRLNIERLTKMFSAFSSFTTSPVGAPLATGPTFSAAASSTPQGQGGSTLGASSTWGRSGQSEGSLLAGLLTGGGNRDPIVTDSMKDMLKVIFSKEGSYAQEILVDEAVAAIDAMSREAMGETLRLVASSAGTVASLRSIEALGPLRAMLLPLPLPLEAISTLQPAVALSNEDRQALNMIRALLDLVMPSPGSSGPLTPGMGARAVKAVGEVAPLLPDLLPGLQVTLEMFVRQLLRRMALRLAEDLDVAAKAQTAQRATRAPQYYSSQPMQAAAPAVHGSNIHHHAAGSPGAPLHQQLYHQNPTSWQPQHPTAHNMGHKSSYNTPGHPY